MIEAEDLRLQTGPHAFVDDLEAPVLAADDHHHLARALRLRDGDQLTLSDARGQWRTATFAEQPIPTGPIHQVPTRPQPLTVALALTKGAKPETAVQKVTEIGIDRVLVFHGERSVPRWDADKQAKAEMRLARVAREAAMQSRRVTVPTVGFVADLRAVVDRNGGSVGCARADFAGSALTTDVHTVVIGPEGGWGDDEVMVLERSVDLGSTVLRAETAAIVAASAMVALRGR